MPKYFDIHSHLNFKDYDADREEVIKRLKETETYTIVVGTDYESSKWAVDLADKYEEIYACIGIHPVDNPSRIFDKEKFEELVKHPKVVAVGECGLDFYHAKKEEDYDRQKKLFLSQIDFALAHDKMIMVHARNAYPEVLEVIAKFPGLKGNIHFFSGSLEEAKKFIELGFTLSFAGPITFAKEYEEVIKNIPIDSILSETDSPFAAPVPYRSKRNEPSYVSEVVKKIAEIRGEDMETVRVALVNNALSMIG